MRQLMSLFPYDQSLITEELVNARYEASARPGAHEALRKLIPQPAAEGETVVKGFPAAAWQRSSRRPLWSMAAKTVWCHLLAVC